MSVLIDPYRFAVQSGVSMGALSFWMDNGGANSQAAVWRVDHSDDGTNWTDSGQSLTFPDTDQSSTTEEKQSLGTAITDRHRYWRFEITTNNSNHTSGYIYEMSFYDADDVEIDLAGVGITITNPTADLTNFIAGQLVDDNDTTKGFRIENNGSTGQQVVIDFGA